MDMLNIFVNNMRMVVGRDAQKEEEYEDGRVCYTDDVTYG